MPAPLLIKNTHIYTPQGEIETGWLLLEDGRIASINSGMPSKNDYTQIDAGGRACLPGFIDIHTHGAVGSEAMDANTAGLEAMGHFYARHGVTSFLATTWAADKLAVDNAVACIRDNLGPLPGGPALLGAHLEGPYISNLKAGAQPYDAIRPVERVEAQAWLNSGAVRLVTTAPEVSANRWLINACKQRGITVSAGHTDATYEKMEEAVRMGITQVTHCFNAMSPLHHRYPGVVGAALAFPELRCELIADLIHVHPGAIRVLWNAKGVDGIILITDSIRAAGLGEGKYDILGQTITIKGGAARLPDGTLAGSLLTMDAALQNLSAAIKQPLGVVWPCSSLVPARAIGIDATTGSLEAGKQADIVLLNPDGSVWTTIRRGDVIYRQLKLSGKSD
jgi:N-acetylglucosamine-6-phosphate deacetylase